MKNKLESILARLKNESKKKGISLQQLLNYFARKFIKSTMSNYKTNLILKVAILYSISEFTSRKIDAIISLMELTGRMKDFYDIYYIATTFDFEGRKLQEALYETLSNRGRAYEKDSITDILRLTEDTEVQKRWDNFCNKILNYELDFVDVVNIIIDFISLPYESIIKEDEFFGIWDSKKRKYDK